MRYRLPYNRESSKKIGLLFVRDVFFFSVMAKAIPLHLWLLSTLSCLAPCM